MGVRILQLLAFMQHFAGCDKLVDSRFIKVLK